MRIRCKIRDRAIDDDGRTGFLSLIGLRLRRRRRCSLHTDTDDHDDDGRAGGAHRHRPSSERDGSRREYAHRRAPRNVGPTGTGTLFYGRGYRQRGRLTRARARLRSQRHDAMPRWWRRQSRFRSRRRTSGHAGRNEQRRYRSIGLSAPLHDDPRRSRAHRRRREQPASIGAVPGDLPFRRGVSAAQASSSVRVSAL